MNISEESLLDMLNLVKWNHAHSDQFWVSFPLVGLCLRWAWVKEIRIWCFLFLSWFHSTSLSVSISLWWGQFCYWKIHIVWTTWPLNSSQLLSWVLQGRNRNHFPYWWLNWPCCLHWQSYVCVFYFMNSLKDAQGKVNSRQVSLCWL